MLCKKFETDHWKTNSFWLLLLLFESVSVTFLGEGDGTPFQCSCLENPIDGGTWWAAVHGVAKSQTQLSYLTFTFHFHALEKEMATHSSVLAWRIPGTAEPGGLPSMGSHRVGHDWSDLAAAAADNENTLWWHACYFLLCGLFHINQGQLLVIIAFLFD